MRFRFPLATASHPGRKSVCIFSQVEESIDFGCAVEVLLFKAAHLRPVALFKAGENRLAQMEYSSCLIL